MGQLNRGTTKDGALLNPPLPPQMTIRRLSDEESRELIEAPRPAVRPEEE